MLRIAARDSRLSRAQTRTVVDMLSSRTSGLEIEVIPIKTLGRGEMERRASEILKRAQGHVFGLGHGVLRDTDPENLRKIARLVHESARSRKY